MNNIHVYKRILELFRLPNKKKKGFTLDNLNGIIELDLENKWINVGEVRVYDIVKHTLKYNLIPLFRSYHLLLLEALLQVYL